MLYLDESGNEVTDTWHESTTDAMQQAKEAKVEFDVEIEEWDLDAPGV